MEGLSQLEVGASREGWTRISSATPHVAGAMVVLGAYLGMLAGWGAQDWRFSLGTSVAMVALGILALRYRAVEQRGNEYRVSSLFHSEIVTENDICMRVRKRGFFWNYLRIHLRRPTRFGWVVSFVPIAEGEASEKTSNRTERTGVERESNEERR